MKKQIILALIILSAPDLFSQVSKGNFLFSAEGSYMKSASETGVTRNYNESVGKYLSLGVSAGYFLTDRFTMGIGIDYYWASESRNAMVMINRFLQMELTEIKTTAYLPNFYVGYYYPIIDKLYINTNLKFSYGNVKSENKTKIAGSVYYPTDNIIVIQDSYSSTYLIGSEKNVKVDFISARLVPELTYFIFSNFSLCLGLGGVEYSMNDWKSDQSVWNINFNPVYWRFGIKLRI